MNWSELADLWRVIAQHLMAADGARFARGVCGRAYYAAYSLVTAHLPERAVFGRGWRNPEHARLPALVNQIAGLHDADRQAIRRALRRLRQRREDADYRPGITVDRRSALESMRDVHQILRVLNRS